ncbi:hypothetical protein AVME950_04995 [Acidovorax sp. SUPP950]|uniref:ogr/Delta-like zinc finger family protein n=1 Tax=Acidovorax sp. SUPP950 TaxID=511901 RepID=UPI0023CD6AB2|nr:ogr/Delta-like zinc finger family protein [Acidovorax sp. SUPP950]GKS74217.1 hypothetical protein AVME950_04995 [Acidovorax sp. SUPP950]
MKLRCPHCKPWAHVRSSTQITPLLREKYLVCTNAACGHAFEVSGRDVMAKASIAAERYADSYDTAFAAYALLEAYKALRDFAEPMARALALIGRTRRDGSIADLSADPIAHRRGFVWDALQNLADGLPEATETVQVEELGTLALRPFAGRKFLSPAVQHQERVMRERVVRHSAS